MTGPAPAVFSRAPHRLEFAGGGTDMPPYSDTDSGLVFNAGIDRYAFASFQPDDSRRITLRSVDFAVECSFGLEEPPAGDDRLALVRAVWNVMKRRGLILRPMGGTLTVESQVRPGSGLGGSSTVCCTVIAAVAASQGVRLDPPEVASLAYDIERVELKMPGGLQDQYAAAFGGFSLMHFEKNLKVDVEPVLLPQEIVRELETRLVLVHTGIQRLSGESISTMQDRHESDPVMMRAGLAQAKTYAMEMKKSLMNNDMNLFGELLSAAWRNKKKFFPSITNGAIDRLFEAAMASGAKGGRLQGAGVGGHLLFLADAGRRAGLETALMNAGAQAVPFKFEPRGVTVSRTIPVSGIPESIRGPDETRG